MNIKTISIIIFTLFFIGCASKQPIKSFSSTIIIKTPNMKYYDNGFIFHYQNYIKLQLFNVGNVILDLDIYQNKICKGTFECLSANDFNEQYLHKSYKSDFLYNLFKNKKVNHRDRKNNILIKIK